MEPMLLILARLLTMSAAARAAASRARHGLPPGTEPEGVDAAEATAGGAAPGAAPWFAAEPGGPTLPEVDTAIENAAMAPSCAPQPETHLAMPEVNLGSITLEGVQSAGLRLEEPAPSTEAASARAAGPATAAAAPLKEEIGNLPDSPPRRKSPGKQHGDWRCLYPASGPSGAGPKGRTPDGDTPPKKEERAISWRFPGNSL